MLPSSEIRPTIKQIVPGGLADSDALTLHDLGQTRHGQLELVLHLRPGEVWIGPRCKGQLDAGSTGRIAGGGQINHLVETGHLLLDDLGDAVFHGLRRGPWIKGLNIDRWGCDRRVLGYGQIIDRQGACQHDDDGDDPGEYRAIQKES